MKKLTFFVFHKEYHEFLQQMQELGVLHVQTSTEGAVPAGSDLALKMEQNTRLHAIIGQLEPLATAPQPKEAVDANAVLARVDELNETRKTVQQQLKVAQSDVHQLAPWGDFDRQAVEGLEQHGYEFHFVMCAKKKFDPALLASCYYTEVATKGNTRYLLVIVPKGGQLPEIGQEAELPRMSLAQAQERLSSLLQQGESIESEMVAIANEALAALKAQEKQVRTSIAFDKVVLDTAKMAEDKLMVLEGWIPEEKAGEVENWLSGQGAYYEIRDPRKEDVVPVLFRNNAFTRMYEVLTKMYGMPNHTDFDPTPIVAPFFSLFFAFCMGDSGYGLILILLGFLLKKKLGKDMAGMMNLVITLGVFTTVLGAVFGTFFGVNLLNTDLPQSMKDFIFAGQVELFGSTYDKLMVLSLGIGVVHISLAMTVKAINSTIWNGFKESLSLWGWWLVVVGSVIVGTLSFLSLIPSEVSTWAFVAVGGIGAVCIYLLNNLHRNVLVNIGAGLWDTYNMASGLMGDLLSYVRLFALGLAGGMLGQTFNQLAFMLVEGQESVAGLVLGWIGCIVILVIGHTLNIAMSCLSAYVHPLRLTFVEYFKNAGYEGKGVEYTPFTIEK